VLAVGYRAVVVGAAVPVEVVLVVSLRISQVVVYVPEVLHSTDRYTLYIVLAENVTPVSIRSSEPPFRNTTLNVLSVGEFNES
jgi:hypothetical protein